MWKWEYNIFNLPHDYDIGYHVEIMVLAKFRCRYCGKGYITILVCYMTTRKHVSLCGFPSQ